MWAIGVDNDQWYDVPSDQRPYVLTSIIKRGDVAAQRLVEIMLDDGPSGVVLRLGVEGGGFDYSRQGDALSDATAAMIDRLVADMASGTVEPPKVSSEPVLLLDDDGNEVESFDDVSSEAVVGVDGLPLGEVVPIGPLDLASLGTSLSLTIDTSWAVMVNQPGHTVLAAPDSVRPGDRDVVFLRPHVLSDPTGPASDRPRGAGSPPRRRHRDVAREPRRRPIHFVPSRLSDSYLWFARSMPTQTRCWLIWGMSVIFSDV